MIGKIIGNYKILSKIGEGGMGAVYLAKDLTLEREVALKIIAPRLAKNPKLMARFKIEAVAQARLTHPNVVTIYSFEQVGDLYFIVMEYIDGESLKSLIKSGKLDIPRAVEIFKQVLSGVAFAHSKGVIHRDIKPANVLITKTGIAKIGDFGIAKLEGVEGLTKAGTSLGTPLYSAPEQILGKKVDHRADIYSLGVMFFEMLTGRPPFVSETGSDYEIQKAHIEKRPPRPSSLNPEIPPVLDRIVLKCLEKNPDKRYSSAEELRRAVEEAFPHTGYTPPPPSRKRLQPRVNLRVPRFSAFVERLRTDRRFLLLTILTLFLIAVVLAIVIIVASSSSSASASLVPPTGEAVGPTGSIGSSVSTVEASNEPETPPSRPNPPPSGPEKPEPPAPRPEPSPPSVREKKPEKPKPRPQPKSPLAQVRELLLSGRFYEAAQRGESLLRENPSQRELILYTGRAFFLAGKYEDAEFYLEKAFDTLGYVKFYVKRVKKYGFGNFAVLKKESTGWLYLTRSGYLKYKTREKPGDSFSVYLGRYEIKAQGVEVGKIKGYWLYVKGMDKSGRKSKAHFTLVLKKMNKEDANFLADLIKKLAGG